MEFLELGGIYINQNAISHIVPKHAYGPQNPDGSAKLRGVVIHFMGGQPLEYAGADAARLMAEWASGPPHRLNVLDGPGTARKIEVS